MPTECFPLGDINQVCDVNTNPTFATDAIIVRVKDIGTKVASTANPNICEELTLAAVAGLTGYKVKLKGMQPAAGKVAGAAEANGFVNAETYPIFIPGVNATNAKLVDSLTQGGDRVLLILTVPGAIGTDSYVRIIGYEAGCLASKLDIDDTAKIGGYSLDLTSDKNKKSAVFLYKTSKAVTDAILTALVTPVVMP